MYFEIPTLDHTDSQSSVLEANDDDLCSDVDSGDVAS